MKDNCSQLNGVGQPVWRSVAAKLVLCASLSLLVPKIYAQATYTWDPLTSASSWMNSARWSGGLPGAIPGVDGNLLNSSDGNSGDVALFQSLGFAGSQLGINMGASANSGVNNETGAAQLLSLGAIDWRSTTRAITIGKRDNTTATSTLRLNGATITPGFTPLSNVLISISNPATHDLTIDNTITGVGATGTMTVELGITNGNFYVNTGRTLGIFSAVSELSPGSGFTKLGGGVLVLGGSNSFTGPVNVQSGVISAHSGNAFGGTSAGTFVADGTAVSLRNGVVIGAETISIKGTGGGATAGNSNGALQAAAGGTGVWGGSVVLDDANARVGTGNGGTLIISGPVQDGLANTLNIGAGLGGTGTVILSGNSTYTGPTNLIRGTLSLGTNNALPATTVLNVDSSNAAESAIFDLAGYNQTVAGLVRTNPLGGGGSLVKISSAGSSTLTVNQAIDTEFSGAITGAVTLEKLGSGTLTLSGANTFSGPTLVAGGTLEAGASSLDGTSSITVDSGGTLLLSGSGERINDLANVTLNGGTLSMEGVSGEAEHLGALILTADSTIDFGSGTANRLIFNSLALGGNTLSIYNWSGSSYLNLTSDPGLPTNQDRLLSMLDPGVVGISSNLIFFADAGTTLIGNGKQVPFTGLDPAYELVPIPEPGSIFSALALVCFMGIRERRSLASFIRRRVR